MFALTASQRFFLYNQPVDMRKAFDGLCGVVQQGMGRDACSGDVYIFLGKRLDRMKLLVWEPSGEKESIYNLAYSMIISSSNLATNIIIDWVGAQNVTQTLWEMGAHDIQVLRGVEDTKAYRQGLSNTTTAYDLMLLYENMALHKVVSDTSCEAMIGILLDQEFNEIIPAQLPAEVKVAHKTGWITGVHHDSGIVYLPDGRKYVLVLLSKNLEDEAAGVETLATVSRMIYDFMQSS